MKEAEIRPDNLMKDQKRLYAQDVENLLKDKNQFVEVNCPACESKASRTIFNKYSLTYVKCEKCRTVYVSPRPTPELIEKYYKNSRNYNYWNEVIFPSTEEARRNSIFIPRVEKTLDILDKHSTSKDLFVEVGPGFGTYAEEMKKRNIFKKIIVVEPTPPLAETCRKKGLEVIEKPIERVELLKDSVDLLANFEVIEHLFEPSEFISNCVSCLKPGGIFILTCPNFEGFDILTLEGASNSIDTEHLNYFNLDSVAFLLEKNGLDVLEKFTPGVLNAELVRNKVLNKEFSLDDQAFLKKVIVDDWNKYGNIFQQFLTNNDLSSNMWVVSRKSKKNR